MEKFSRIFGGPKYDGKYLRSLVKSTLGNLTTKQTLTDIVIPTFDIKRLQPIIFTTLDVQFFLPKQYLVMSLYY